MMVKGGFTKKSVGTMTLGEKLKKLRSDKRTSLAEVSRATKIQIKYLESLEAGNFEVLPADVYVKGFLRNYGEFLGIDENILIKLYDKEKGIQKNLEKNKNPEKFRERIEPVNISSFVFTPKKAAISFIILAVLGTLVYLYREIGSFANAPFLVVLNPQSELEINSATTIVEGKADSDARLFINNQAVLVNAEGFFREEISLHQGVNTIEVKSINRFNKETSEVLTLKANFEEPKKDEEEKKEEIVESPEEINLELWVDSGPVWISVEADDKLVFSGNVLTGGLQVFKAKEQINISSGKANATFIKLNGKDYGTLGKDGGAVKDIVFTRESGL